MGEGKKDAETHRLTGRAEDNRLVHFEVPAGSDAPAPRRRRLGRRHPRGAVPPARRRARRRTAAHPPHPRRRRLGSHAGRVLRASRRPPAASGAPRAVSLGLPDAAHRRCEPLTPRRDHAARPGGRCALIAVVGATGTGKSALVARPRRGARRARPRRRDRQRRRHAAVPRHGHRHGEAPARRAARHPASPVRRARRHRRGGGRLVSGGRARRDRRDPRPRRDAILVGGSGLYVSSVIFDFRFPPHGCRAARAARGRARRARPGHAASPGSREPTPRPPRASTRSNGRRIVRALEVLASGRAARRRACPRSPCCGARTRDHRAAQRRATSSSRGSTRASSGCGRTDSSTRSRRLAPHGLEHGVTARRAIGYAQALAQLPASCRRPRRSPRRRRSRAATRGGRSRGSSGTRGCDRRIDADDAGRDRGRASWRSPGGDHRLSGCRRSSPSRKVTAPATTS